MRSRNWKFSFESLEIFQVSSPSYEYFRKYRWNVCDIPTVPICSSITWWQAHKRAFETFHLNFENFLDTLSTSYVKRKEAEALGLFIQGSSCQTIATNLMLLDVFKSKKPLILFFQTSKGACSVGMQTLTMSYVSKVWTS